MQHDGHVMGKMRCDRKVVGHKKIGGVRARLNIQKQIDHLCLDGDIERADRLIEQEDGGAWSKGSGDAEALALTAGKLMREHLHVISPQAHLLEQSGDRVFVRR